MKKTLLAIATVLAMTTLAQAEENQSPAWVCNMNFSGKSTGVQFIIGKYVMKGKGTIRCLGALGETAEIPVDIKMKSTFISPTISLEKMKVYGEALSIMLFSTNPQDLLGDYLVAHADAAVGVGAGAFAATKLSLPDLTLQIGLRFNVGVGFHLGIEKMKISLDETRVPSNQ